MSARLAPTHCDIAAAIAMARDAARRLQQDVLVTWGAVSFRVSATDTPQSAWTAYLESARLLIRLEDAAKGRSFGQRQGAA